MKSFIAASSTEFLGVGMFFLGVVTGAELLRDFSLDAGLERALMLLLVGRKPLISMVCRVKLSVVGIELSVHSVALLMCGVRYQCAASSCWCVASRCLWATSSS